MKLDNNRIRAYGKSNNIHHRHLPGVYRIKTITEVELMLASFVPCPGFLPSLPPTKIVHPVFCEIEFLLLRYPHRNCLLYMSHYRIENSSLMYFTDTFYKYSTLHLNDSETGSADMIG